MVTAKDIFYLVLGVVIGLIAGVAVYWWPLGQFVNEWKAIWNLVRKRYRQGDLIKVRTGTHLESVPSTYGLTVAAGTRLLVWHDEGVGWFHASVGWKRARILRVFKESEENIIYKVCHLDIET